VSLIVCNQLGHDPIIVGLEELIGTPAFHLLLYPSKLCLADLKVFLVPEAILRYTVLIVGVLLAIFGLLSFLLLSPTFFLIFGI
jgi:hypothetical protein